MRFKGSTIFVTGGAGFIGSAVVRHLLRDTGAFVVNIDKLTYAANLHSIPDAASNPRYSFQKVDICEGPLLRELFDWIDIDPKVLKTEANSRKPNLKGQ